MTQSDYILVTGSRNLNDGSSDSDAKVHEEDEGASLNALEEQGISILNDTNRPSIDEPRDQLSRELMNEGGIEIIQGDEEDAFL